MEHLVRRACQADDEIEVFPSIGSLSEMRSELMRREVDVVIAGITSGDDAGLALALLALRPRVRVLLIAAQEGVAELLALRPQRTRLGAVTPADILRAVRDSSTHAADWADFDDPGVDGGR
jgi:hypothetical protein